MKTKDIILLSVVVLLIIVGLIFTTKKPETKNYSIRDLSDLNVGINDIDYNYFETLTKEEGTYILYIGRDNCGYCQKYHPLIKEASEENSIKILYINTNNLTENEYNSLSSTLGNHFTGTPTTLLMNGKDIIDEISGYVEKEKIIEFFEKNGLVG